MEVCQICNLLCEFLGVSGIVSSSALALQMQTSQHSMFQAIGGACKPKQALEGVSMWRWLPENPPQESKLIDQGHTMRNKKNKLFTPILRMFETGYSNTLGLYA